LSDVAGWLVASLEKGYISEFIDELVFRHAQPDKLKR
jgi:hypothetical protein